MIHRHEKEFPVLETKRLVLREITTDDAHDIFKYLSDKEVMKYYGLLPFRTNQEAINEIEWYKKIYDAKTGIRWGITMKNIDAVIGSCGFLNWSQEHFRTEIGAELSKAYWRKGIMSEAFQAIIRYGFNQMELMRIQGLIEPPNTSSQKLAEKNGFIREGLLRKYEYAAGKFDDLYMYSLLKDDDL
ncbi:GNAT family N-acetyltransferase [Hazenella sp. IB182357]|uniref:GNAT family N-acetyltransferase n=1 Tax=Polycladospora coralii TaxID=2771432 RepID=A0A926RUK5_9BACL|nr:GNAT family protein [Polycladospora coralii]MBD1372692.1 GNAT family N-acetyltransferase [Polycladospora coralii]MBS7531086.1 GNAT family N-acetyltransferase [Polycladospora coralii]